MSEDKRLVFSNNESLNEFVITIARVEGTDSDTNSDTFRKNSDTPNSDSDTNRSMCLNKKEKDVVNYCTIPRSSKEILERVGVSYHSKNIDKYINALVEAGYLEMTNHDNPNASNQKYRKKK